MPTLKRRILSSVKRDKEEYKYGISELLLLSPRCYGDKYDTRTYLYTQLTNGISMYYKKFNKSPSYIVNKLMILNKENKMIGNESVIYTLEKVKNCIETYYGMNEPFKTHFEQLIMGMYHRYVSLKYCW